MNAPNAGEVQRWLRYAQEDLAAARAIFADKHLPSRVVCFHCQQAVEKALKAALLHGGVMFPRTHDLNLLARLLPDASSIKKVCPDLSGLMVYAAETRYPGDLPDLREDDARRAIEVAVQILNLVQPVCA